MDRLPMERITSWETLTLNENHPNEFLTITETIDLSIPEQLEQSIFAFKWRVDSRMTLNFSKYGSDGEKSFTTTMYLPNEGIKRNLKSQMYLERALYDAISYSHHAIGHIGNEIHWVYTGYKYLQFDPFKTLPNQQAIQKLLLMIIKIKQSIMYFIKNEYIKTNLLFRTYDTELKQYVILPSNENQTTKLPDPEKDEDAAAAPPPDDAADKNEDYVGLSEPVSIDIVDETDEKFKILEEFESLDEAEYKIIKAKIQGYTVQSFIESRILSYIDFGRRHNRQKEVNNFVKTANKECQFVMQSILLRLIDDIWAPTDFYSRQFIQSLYLRNGYPDRIELRIEKKKSTKENPNPKRPYINLYFETKEIEKDWILALRQPLEQDAAFARKEDQIIAAKDKFLYSNELQFLENPAMFLQFQYMLLADRIVPAINRLDESDKWVTEEELTFRRNKKAFMLEQLKEIKKRFHTLFVCLKRYQHTNKDFLALKPEDSANIDLKQIAVFDAAPNAIASKYTAR